VAAGPGSNLASVSRSTQAAEAVTRRNTLTGGKPRVEVRVLPADSAGPGPEVPSQEILRRERRKSSSDDAPTSLSSSDDTNTGTPRGNTGAEPRQSASSQNSDEESRSRLGNRVFDDAELNYSLREGELDEDRPKKRRRRRRRRSSETENRSRSERREARSETQGESRGEGTSRSESSSGSSDSGEESFSVSPDTGSREAAEPIRQERRERSSEERPRRRRRRRESSEDSGSSRREAPRIESPIPRPERSDSGGGSSGGSDGGSESPIPQPE
jgi:hypothetical protein